MKFLFFFILVSVLGFQLDQPNSYNHSNVKVKDVQFHIVTEGPKNGPLVVLLHGFPESWYMFKHQIHFFTRLGYRTVALDLLGYGGSSSQISHLLYSCDITEYFQRLINQMGYEKALFVGHDIGAKYAWHMGWRFPKSVNGIISIGLPFNKFRNLLSEASKSEHFRIPKFHILNTFLTDGDTIHPALRSFLNSKEVYQANPYASYLNSLSVSNITEMNNNIDLVLRAFLSPSVKVRNQISTIFPVDQLIPFLSKLNLTNTTVLSKQDYSYVKSQFEKFTFSGPLKYYQNILIDILYPNLSYPKFNSSALLIQGDEDGDNKMGNDGEEFIKDLTTEHINGGHWIHLTHTKKVHQVILKWIKKNPKIPKPRNELKSIKAWTGDFSE